MRTGEDNDGVIKNWRIIVVAVNCRSSPIYRDRWRRSYTSRKREWKARGALTRGQHVEDAVAPRGKEAG
jgi:hypothetical protein